MIRPTLAAAHEAVALTEQPLEIVVPFTTAELTRVALEKAGQLAFDLDVKIRLIWAQTVPFPHPLECPPVDIATFQEAVHELVERFSVITEQYLTRDADHVWVDYLQPHSLVVIATTRHFWRTGQEKLAGKMRRNGHDVLLLMR